MRNAECGVKTVSPVHPVARGLATVFGIAGTLLARDPASLAAVWIGVLIPFCIKTMNNA